MKACPVTTSNSLWTDTICRMHEDTLGHQTFAFWSNLQCNYTSTDLKIHAKSLLMTVLLRSFCVA